jgi:hypothetical protein
MKRMKQTLNAQRSTPNAQLGKGPESHVGRWTLATAEPVQDGGDGLGVGRFPANLP